MVFRRQNVNQWFLGVILHLVLFQIAGELKEKDAVLPDAYLRSETQCGRGPANRLFLIVIEGLRWDVFSTNLNISTFSARITNVGTAGPMYTNLPNIGYSGLLQIATGVPEIEELSNVGNVFQIARTFYIGPPSVLKVLSGLKESYCYPEVWENLTVSPNETKGDEWVFKKWSKLLLEPTIENTKVFFFYLRGLSIASQLDGPLSYRALKEMKYIFDNIGELYINTENLFIDRNTAYIVTSDRGFSEGHRKINSLNETIVPFIAWGAGLASTREITAEVSSQLNRKAIVNTEDLTPLISYLLGTPIPFNSFGEAPVIRLSTNKDRAKMLFLNAQQLSELFLSFQKSYGFGIARFCAPLNKNIIDNYLSEIEQLFLHDDYELSISKAQDLIKLSLDGINYYRIYEAKMLWICALVSLIGWTIVTFGWIIQKVKITPVIQREMVPERQEDRETPTVKNKSIFLRFITPLFLINTAWFIVFSGVIGVLIFISAPLTVSLAAILANITSWLACKSSLGWIRLWRSVSFHDLKIEKGKPLIHLAYFLVFTCVLTYPIVVQVMFSFAIMFSALSDLRHNTGSHLAYWMLSSLSYLILLHYSFNTPYLPVLMIAAMVWIIGGGIFLHCLKVRYIDCPIILVAFLSIALISIHSQYGPPTTEKNLILRWTPILLIFFVPAVGSSSLPVRLFQLCLCLSVSIFLLSLSYEPISFLVIISHVFSWALLEGYRDTSEFFASSLHFQATSTSITWVDVRRSFYFLAYIATSFLVLGNSCEIYNWAKEWSSYFEPISGLQVFIIVCLKSIPVILIDNIFFAILEKASSVGYQSLILHLTSQASLINFLIIPESPVTSYNQLMFLFSLILRPIAYLLLTPSIFSVLLGSVVPTIIQGRSPENMRPMSMETSL